MSREEKKIFIKQQLSVRLEQYTDNELDIIVDMLMMYLETK